MIANPDKLHNYARFITLLAALGVLFWGLGSIPLLSLNEARRAVPIQEMLVSGNWLLPHLNGELYITKPPLFYWLGSAMAILLGSASEWAVRLPSALAAFAVLWATYRIALNLFGRWSALFATQTLLANAGFAILARRAEIEMLLTGLCSLSLLAALNYIVGDHNRRWLLLGYVLLGFALLCKGPVALLFVILPMLGYALYCRDPYAWQALRCAEGWLLLLLIGLSWYGAVIANLGMDAWLGVIRSDVLGKMQGSEGTREPFYYYLLWVLGDFAPAVLLLFISPIKQSRREAEKLRLLDTRDWLKNPATALLVFAFVLPLLTFSLFGDKHAKYLLPAYPALALLLGHRLAELSRDENKRWLKIIGILLPLGWFAYFAVGEARLYHYRYLALPKMTALLKSHPGVPVYAYGELDMRMVYYHGQPIPLLKSLQAANAPALLLAEQHAITELAQSPNLCLLQEFEPYLKRGKKAAVFGSGTLCIRNDNPPSG